VAGDDDDLGARLGAEAVDFGKHVEAVAVGEPDVEQHDVVGCILDEDERLGGGGGGGHGVALFAEYLFERGADFGFVVDDEDVMRHGRRSLLQRPRRRRPAAGRRAARRG
jgi:hypothetical protein